MFNAARITEGKQTHSAAPDGGIIRFQLMAALGLEGRLFYPQNCCLFVVGAFFSRQLLLEYVDRANSHQNKLDNTA